MSEFKVGDKVRIVSKKRSASGEKYDGEVVTIKEILTQSHHDGEEYALIEEHVTTGIWLNELEVIKPEVVKQVTVRVKAGNTVVYHTTNTRRKLIVISGKRTIDDLDNLIDALKQLKEEL